MCVRYCHKEWDGVICHQKKKLSLSTHTFAEVLVISQQSTLKPPSPLHIFMWPCKILPCPIVWGSTDTGCPGAQVAEERKVVMRNAVATGNTNLSKPSPGGSPRLKDDQRCGACDWGVLNSRSPAQTLTATFVQESPLSLPMFQGLQWVLSSLRFQMHYDLTECCHSVQITQNPQASSGCQAPQAWEATFKVSNLRTFLTTEGNPDCKFGFTRIKSIWGLWESRDWFIRLLEAQL